ncbi:MAG: LPS export ABC transporter periplasmic protein LptC [Candidatus Omnitrophica bacterium]|nr:LPS export ABC transporter periplasmic protein LptC [Candidatus Omnitrophota bacterium]
MRLNEALIVCAAFFLCFAPAFGSTTTDQESDQQIADFSLSGYGEKGKKSWDIAGKSADIFTDEVKLKDVDGNLYGKEEDVNLTAKTGNFNKKNGLVHLEKDVVITTSKGAKLTTNSMDWDRNKQLVATEDKVNIAKDNINISGTGARGEPSLKKVALNKDVKVDINQADASLAKTGDLAVKEKITVTCDGSLTVDYEKNIATFNKNVKVEKSDSVIYSDTMVLYFSSGKDSPKVKEDNTAGLMGNNKIDKIVARGNVRIVRGENTSYSDEAVYSALEKKIILSGKPKLVFYSTKDLTDASFGN